jgi:hypothetical protein|tara:strand:- start:606 stop:839 length:234 start_codon:yes stop_codon:yes gene_type:complete
MVTKVTGKMVDDVILIGDRIDAEMSLTLEEGMEPLHIAAGALHSALSFTLGTAPSEEAAWELVEKTIKFHKETLKDD